MNFLCESDCIYTLLTPGLQSHDEINVGLFSVCLCVRMVAKYAQNLTMDFIMEF